MEHIIGQARPPSDREWVYAFVNEVLCMSIYRVDMKRSAHFLEEHVPLRYLMQFREIIQSDAIVNAEYLFRLNEIADAICERMNKPVEVRSNEHAAEETVLRVGTYSNLFAPPQSDAAIAYHHFMGWREIVDACMDRFELPNPLAPISHAKLVDEKATWFVLWKFVCISADDDKLKDEMQGLLEALKTKRIRMDVGLCTKAFHEFSAAYECSANALRHMHAVLADLRAVYDPYGMRDIY